MEIASLDAKQSLKCDVYGQFKIHFQFFYPQRSCQINLSNFRFSSLELERPAVDVKPAVSSGDVFRDYLVVDVAVVDERVVGVVTVAEIGIVVQLRTLFSLQQ